MWTWFALHEGWCCLPALDGGLWDDCVRLADVFIAECEAGAPHTLQASVHCHRGSIRLARDDMEGAVEDAERALELARGVQQPDRVFQSLAFAVRAFAASGAIERARELASEFDFHHAWRQTPAAGVVLHPLRLGGVGSRFHGRAGPAAGGSEAADEVDRRDAVDLGWRLLREPPSSSQRWKRGRTRRTRDCARPSRSLPTEQRTEADEQLAKALVFFRSVGATRYMREAEALLSTPLDEDVARR